MSQIQENIVQLQARIQKACEDAGRDPDDITIVAISKRQPESVILEALEAGLRHFGENRLAEAQDKIVSIATQTDILPHWHMVGHIQSRKAKHIPGLFTLVHSVDSVKLAHLLSEHNPEDADPLNILLEINISGEASKGGFVAHRWQQSKTTREALFEDVRQIVDLPGVTVRGLMTMAPYTSDADLIRSVFTGLADLRDEFQEHLAIPLPELSMGMTNDYPIAIACGATLIRPGTAIFGERRI